MLKKAIGSIGILALTAGVVGSGCVVENRSGGDAEGPAAPAAPAAGEAKAATAEDLPLLEAVPENELPPGFDESRGFAEYRLRDGHRVAIISAVNSPAEAPAAQDAVGSQAQALTTTVPAIRDTWVRRTAAGTTDFGRSCELRVNNILNSTASEFNLALLQFPIPTVVTCATIISARLFLKTAQNPSTGATLVVFPHRITQPWAPGQTGAAVCSSCYVTSGAPAAFGLPPFTPLNVPVPVNRPCTTYSWDITPMVAGGAGWCAAPVSNRGVLMAGRNGVVTVNFHSNEALAAGDRPRLVITY
ncbi:MAG TPA: DNRLRE domain-containing protein [Polyangiaceae bacterium]|nr:DNRLRE domain-containing protein [Polyangiaceae bacterium]